MDLVTAALLAMAAVLTGALILKRRSARWRKGLITALLGVGLGLVPWQARGRDWVYAHVPLGTERSQIVALLGPPIRITDCTTTYGGYVRGESEEAAEGCAAELWYYSRVIPEAYSYTFDANGKLIDKYHWVSP